MMPFLRSWITVAIALVYAYTRDWGLLSLICIRGVPFLPSG